MTKIEKYQQEIQKLTQKNEELKRIIEIDSDILEKAKKSAQEIDIINRPQYLLYKSVAKQILRHQTHYDRYNSRYVRNLYRIKWLQLILPDLSRSKQEQKYLTAEWYYQYIDYIKNTTNKNPIFPYDIYRLCIIAHWYRRLAFNKNRLVYLSNVKLRTLILAHKSTWRIKLRINFLQRRVNNYQTKIKDLLSGYVNRFHASYVNKLEHAKKNKNAVAYQQKLEQSKNARKTQYLQQKSQLQKQIFDLKNNYLHTCQDLKKANLSKLDYQTKKSTAYDSYQKQKAEIKEQKIKLKNNYLNYSDFDNCTYAIELNNVVKYYNNRVLATKVLDHVNLKIKRGEFVVILGPSGSGKTTLLNIISGLDNASYGDVLVANENIIDYSQHELTQFRRVNIGYVFQQYGLIPNLTVRENVEIGQNLQKNKNRWIDIDEILTQIGIKEQANRYPNELSGGQQQRVSIARSIAKNPNILFGDEPTGAVDEKMSKEIMRLFININQKYHTTIVIVTHNPILAQLASTVVHVGNGTIVKVQHNPHPKTVDQINWSGITLAKS